MLFDSQTALFDRIYAPKWTSVYVPKVMYLIVKTTHTKKGEKYFTLTQKNALDFLVLELSDHKKVSTKVKSESLDRFEDYFSLQDLALFFSFVIDWNHPPKNQ